MGEGIDALHPINSIDTSAPIHWPIKDRQASDQCNWIDHGKERERKKKTHLPGDTMYNCIDHVIYNKK